MFRKKLKVFLWGFGFFCFFSFLIISWFSIPWLPHQGLLLLFLSGLFFVVVALFWPILDKLSREALNFKYGKEGEETIFNMLCKTLDDNYVYIPNYNIPNAMIGDIDGLLIGPKGIIILEIKNWAGDFRISGTDAYKRLRGNIYKLYKKSPFKQTARQQKYLTKFLKEKGISTKITPIIVLVCGKINSISGKTEIFITEKNNLINYIFKLTPVPDFLLGTTEKILEALNIPKN